jgi:hypothetical protein
VSADVRVALPVRFIVAIAAGVLTAACSRDGNAARPAAGRPTAVAAASGFGLYVHFTGAPGFVRSSA